MPQVRRHATHTVHAEEVQDSVELMRDYIILIITGSALGWVFRGLYDLWRG